MYTYSQSSGHLTDGTGKLVATGYSGTKDGRNNPDMQNVQGVGPIPRGTYKIGPVRLSQRLGPVVMDLDPTPATNTFGRSLFRIHGDNSIDDASHGCVILPRPVREAIAASKDRVLEVVV